MSEDSFENILDLAEKILKGDIKEVNIRTKEGIKISIYKVMTAENLIRIDIEFE